MTRKKAKPLMKMTAEELAAATAEFDQENIADTFSAPPPEAQAQLARMKRRRGRPRKGRGAKVISVSVEKGLLARCDRLAEKLGVSRAELIARGLRSAFITAGEE